MASGFCARPDPLIEAGLRYCRTCGATAYPYDAGWLADDLLLASFSAVCVHSPEPLTQIVTPSELEPFELPSCRACGAPLDSRADELCGSCRCRADIWTGTRCRNRAKDRGLCGVHAAQRQRQATQERR